MGKQAGNKATGKGRNLEIVTAQELKKFWLKDGGMRNGSSQKSVSPTHL